MRSIVAVLLVAACGGASSRAASPAIANRSAATAPSCEDIGPALLRNLPSAQSPEQARSIRELAESTARGTVAACADDHWSTDLIRCVVTHADTQPCALSDEQRAALFHHIAATTSVDD